MVKDTDPRKDGRRRSLLESTTASSVVPIERSGGITSQVAIWQRSYSRVRDLAEGRMGKVVLAERRSDSVRVCLKFLNTQPDASTLEQECRVLMRLRHPSIVSLLDFSLQDKPPWLATEYVDGSTLQKHMTEHAPMPFALVAKILKQVLDGLAYAHDEAVIHRDLKPANLMISVESGVQVRIIDFGIAIIDKFDHEGRVTAQYANLLGTLQYMAPEQFEGQLLSAACDLYAVGLMAWEMLMGRSIFNGMTLATLMHEKLNHAEGFDLEVTSGSLPAPFVSFVKACTRAQPSSRPTALEGLAMLDALP